MAVSFLLCLILFRSGIIPVDPETRIRLILFLLFYILPEDCVNSPVEGFVWKLEIYGEGGFLKICYVY